ncbi:MAG: 2-polyprenyl-3-methyl-6-methoxy-1,4-benzoquinone monooxygenase [Gammaproteobacteria bacterium]|nr:2-polyprenyl-3-methyl-6-methoxy-1,4-benzoquinone monooxygenase [Gammaproteobacteria bacterium]
MNFSPTTFMDGLIAGVDQTLRQLHRVSEQGAPPARRTQRVDLSSSPEPLEDQQRQLSGRLMRVNHSGEVAAQALYHGQALGTRDPALAQALREAADEEAEHLDWCEQRLGELLARPSVLNPLWYAGSFALGYTAALAGDRWSLGFIGETEHQVVQHLDEHLKRLPAADQRSRHILETMQADEARHGESAMAAGGQELPGIIKRLMRHAARVMTRTAFWL